VLTTRCRGVLGESFLTSACFREAPAVGRRRPCSFRVDGIAGDCASERRWWPGVFGGERLSLAFSYALSKEGGWMRVLIAGETWSTHKIEIKGFAAYTTGAYDVGLTEWVAALRNGGHEVTHIANHEAIDRFPWTLDDFQRFDVVVMSDIPADTIQLHPA